MRQTIFLVVAAAPLALWLAPPAFAQYPDVGDEPNRSAAAPAPAAAASGKTAEPVLTPEEVAEREGRKACKVAICGAFRARRADGGDIACTVLKSWRKEQLDKMLAKAKVTWPWGRVRCSADVKLKRDALIRAMTNEKFETQLDRHHVGCTVDRGKEAPAQVTFDFSPKVTFEKGKAVKASLNWGKIEGPSLVKGAMWTATATDNAFNVLQGTLVEDINDFIGKKCDEVRDNWDRR
jgi:hypothetical protein